MFDRSQSKKVSKPLTKGLNFRKIYSILFAGIALVIINPETAQASEVYFVTQNGGGFGFSGKYSDIKKLYPLAFKASESGAFSKSLLSHINAVEPDNYKLKINTLSDNDKSYNKSIVLMMVLDGETESVEQYELNGSPIYKMDIALHAEAVFFDYAKKTVIYSVPVSEQYIGTLNHYPSKGDAQEATKEALYLEPHNNLVERLTNSIKSISLPKGLVKFVQVTKVKLSPLAMQTISKHPGMGWTNIQIAKSAVANQFSSALEGVANIPLEPYTIGSTIGKMAVAFSNDSAYNFKLPKPSYHIHLTLMGFKNVPYSSGAAGYSQIYGAFVHIKMIDPLVNKNYIDATFKNGVVKIIPRSQVTIAAGPAYLSAINGLFVKFANSLNDPTGKWVHSLSQTPNVSKMLGETNKALESCKI